jgi:hypothetical protein
MHRPTKTVGRPYVVIFFFVFILVLWRLPSATGADHSRWPVIGQWLQMPRVRRQVCDGFVIPDGPVERVRQFDNQSSYTTDVYPDVPLTIPSRPSSAS